MLWLSVRLPLLPLDAALRAVPELNEQQSIAISEQQRIICCNAIAYRLGVRSRQTVSSSYAIAGQLRVLERRWNQEQQLLEQLAIILSQFSPRLHYTENSVRLEIGHSLKLFHGLEPLLEAIKNTLKNEAMTYQLGVGPTPKMADLFARCSQQHSIKYYIGSPTVPNNAGWINLLGQYPVEYLALTNKDLNKLQSLGIVTLEALLKLPSDSLRKRLGDTSFKYFKQLLGHSPDTHSIFSPPTEFLRKTELIDVLHTHTQLEKPMSDMLQQLMKFLTLQKITTQKLRWSLTDSYQQTLNFIVTLAEPSHQLSVYQELTQIKLEHQTLTGPIETIELTVCEFSEAQQKTNSLFQEAEAFDQNLNFVSKIQAQLGESSCYRLEPCQTMIPELAQRITPNNIVPSQVSSTEQFISEPVMASRPSWLFSHPKPIKELNSQLFWQGHLKPISQEERISGYWWKKSVDRGYYVAEHSSGSLYWIFFDYLKQAWFIHGIYA